MHVNNNISVNQNFYSSSDFTKVTEKKSKSDSLKLDTVNLKTKKVRDLQQDYDYKEKIRKLAEKIEKNQSYTKEASSAIAKSLLKRKIEYVA